MNGQITTNGHIEITETLVRLYVFLTQELDRCENGTSGQTFPEHELQSHLPIAPTRPGICQDRFLYH